VKHQWSTWTLSDSELDLALDALYAYAALERGRRPRTAEAAHALRRRILAGFVAAAWQAEAGEWVQDPLPESTET
jgi:hypothetical protein